MATSWDDSRVKVGPREQDVEGTAKRGGKGIEAARALVRVQLVSSGQERFLGYRNHGMEYCQSCKAGEGPY